LVDGIALTKQSRSLDSLDGTSDRAFLKRIAVYNSQDLGQLTDGWCNDRGIAPKKEGLQVSASKLTNVRKLAQMAAYFLNRAGGSMEHVKLMKLMYLADRECMNRYWFSISDDDYYSMRAGPVLSLTLDLMSDNEGAEAQGEWCEWVSIKQENHVSLQKKDLSETDIDELADEEIEVLKQVADRFGGWPLWDLVGYTHKLKEWKDPGNGREQITIRSIFEALGKPADMIESNLLNLPTARPNTTSPVPTTLDAMLSHLTESHTGKPPQLGIYAEKIDAILSAQ
jgi:uncharacterized phage-associated protein